MSVCMYPNEHIVPRLSRHLLSFLNSETSNLNRKNFTIFPVTLKKKYFTHCYYILSEITLMRNILSAFG